LLQSLYASYIAAGALLLVLLFAIPVTAYAEDKPPAPDTLSDTEQNLPAPDTLSDTELNPPAPDTLSDTEQNLPAPDTLSDTELNSPAPDTLSDTELNPPAPDTLSDTESNELVGDPLAADITPELDIPPTNPCDRTHDSHEYDPSWYDSTHAVMNTVFCEPALWFDSFYGSDRVIAEVGGTYVRWRNDFIQIEGQGFRFRTNLNFSIELPKISHRLKLTFEGDEDPVLQDVLPDDQAEQDTNTLGFRLDVKETDRSNFNISVSAKPRIRARYRYTYPVSDKFLIRFTQEIQNEKGVNGARTRIDFEKAIPPAKLFRATTEGFISEEFDGVDWAQAFILFKRLSQKSSVSYEVSAAGITRPESLVTNYRLGIRYRQNIHRDWLFFEVTPDVSWPIGLSEDRETITSDRHSVMSIIVRLEIHFANTGKRKYSDYIY